MDARERALSALAEAENSRAKLLEIHNGLREKSSELGRLFLQSSALVDKFAKAIGSQADLLQATKNMQEAQMSFNLQYRQLQRQMQNENRTFTSVSNVLKTRHDTAKNSISNIR